MNCSPLPGALALRNGSFCGAEGDSVRGHKLQGRNKLEARIKLLFSMSETEPTDSQSAADDGSSSNLVVALATYNERENIAQLVPEIRRLLPRSHVLIVDDNSPDGTGELADSMAAGDAHIHVLHREGKLGLGTAVVAAFDWAIEHQYGGLVTMDADYSHPPRYLPAIVQAASKADVVIGSRYVSGGSIAGWGLKRHVMSRSINFYSRLMLGLKTRDNSGNYRYYHVSKLAEVDWSKAVARGYGFVEEILYRLSQAGATFTEVPIRFEERRFGSSKINWKEAVEAGLTFLKLPFTPSAKK